MQAWYIIHFSLQSIAGIPKRRFEIKGDEGGFSKIYCCQELTHISDPTTSLMYILKNSSYLMDPFKKTSLTNYLVLRTFMSTNTFISVTIRKLPPVHKIFIYLRVQSFAGKFSHNYNPCLINFSSVLSLLSNAVINFN